MPSGTAASEQLTAKLKSMSVTSPLPEYPNCFPEVNPVDIYRAHLTSILAEVTGVDSKIIYPALQWTQTLEKGDLVLPVPALRVKGKKPDELAAEWIQKVGT
jgi:arginyl-tRNA synthetase